MECEGRKAWTSLTELRDGRSVLTTSGRYHLNVLRLSCRPLEGEQGVILGKAALDLPLSTIMGECSPGFKVKLEFWFVKSLLEAFFFLFWHEAYPNLLQWQQRFASSVKAISIIQTCKEAAHLHQAIKGKYCLRTKDKQWTNCFVCTKEKSECVSFVARGRLMAVSGRISHSLRSYFPTLLYFAAIVQRMVRDDSQRRIPRRQIVQCRCAQLTDPSSHCPTLLSATASYVLLHKGNW